MIIKILCSHETSCESLPFAIVYQLRLHSLQNFKSVMANKFFIASCEDVVD